MRSLFGPGRERKRDDLIDRLCRESGRWMVVSREEDDYRVRAVGDYRAVQYVGIRCGAAFHDVVFQSWFSVRFPLDNPPSGLFGRLLMRNFMLKQAAWALQIEGSCEAGLCCCARVPKSALVPCLFDIVCRELVNEIDDFHQELRDKFRWAGGEVVPGRGANHGYGSFGQADPGVRFIEPVQHHAGPVGRYRVLPGQKG